ncbi:MAG: MazF family transcriptional regulator [Gammaproteobacteria bacterium RIFCSPHIGHO2_12_FULL_42_10]|nr:MAG: MazF family transcriptional regulator [Gammaproteobacteria bacterium RIFCSPHIGHO2_12_FULL_42_10]
MVAEVTHFTRGGVYLARLDPAKAAETGKIRPIVVLTAQGILNIAPPILFICPLSRQSQPAFSGLHVLLPPRDHLEVTSYALTEHCRSVSIQRIIHPRLAQLTATEIQTIITRLQRLIGVISL